MRKQSPEGRQIYPCVHFERMCFRQAQVSFAFSGNAFRFIRNIGPNRGVMDVCFDGSRQNVEYEIRREIVRAFGICRAINYQGANV